MKWQGVLGVQLSVMSYSIEVQSECRELPCNEEAGLSRFSSSPPPSFSLRLSFVSSPPLLCFSSLLSLPFYTLKPTTDMAFSQSCLLRICSLKSRPLTCPRSLATTPPAAPSPHLTPFPTSPNLSCLFPNTLGILSRRSWWSRRSWRRCVLHSLLASPSYAYSADSLPSLSLLQQQVVAVVDSVAVTVAVAAVDVEVDAEASLLVADLTAVVVAAVAVVDVAVRYARSPLPSRLC